MGLLSNISKRKAAIIIIVSLVFIVIAAFLVVTYNNLLQNEFWQKTERYISVIFTLYTVFIGIVIFLESKNPSKTIAWLLILFLVPVVGFIFYLFIGQDIRKRRVFKKKKILDSKHLTYLVDLETSLLKDTNLFNKEESFIKKKLMKLLLKNSKSPFTINNKAEILTNGRRIFESIIEELKRAQAYIHIEYFIIRDDQIGNKIREILIEKAKAGVEVRLIYDSVGCWKLSKAYIDSLKEAGVEVYPFFPVFFPVLSREINYRNHRKIVVIDGKIGFTGGINIGDEYLGKDSRLGFWRDTNIKIEGEAVYSLQNTFLKDWEFVSGNHISEDKYYPKLRHYGEALIQITASGPDANLKAILQAYFTMVTAAKDRIWITTPYLVPEDSLNTALMVAALSGIDVRIIIPSKPDHILAYWASMDNVEDLLKSGVKIYKYEKGFIHSKLLIVDELGASVGTANLDIRSLEIDFEVNAFIYDEAIVKRLEEDYLEDLKESKEILLNEHQERSIIVKFKESIGRLLSPLI